MAEWVKVAELRDLTRRRKMAVTVGDEQIALFWVGEEKVYALRDICIHKQRQLSNGTLFNGKVVCPGHQWTFDLESGWEADQEECQPTYAVKVENGEVHVDPTSRVLDDAPVGSA